MERNSETPRVVPFVVFKGLLVLHWDLEYKFKRETLKVEAAAKRSFLFLREEEEGGRDLLIL